MRRGNLGQVSRVSVAKPSRAETYPIKFRAGAPPRSCIACYAWTTAGVGRMQSAVLFAGMPGPDRKVAVSLIRKRDSDGGKNGGLHPPYAFCATVVTKD